MKINVFKNQGLAPIKKPPTDVDGFLKIKQI